MLLISLNHKLVYISTIKIEISELIRIMATRKFLEFFWKLFNSKRLVLPLVILIGCNVFRVQQCVVKLTTTNALK